MRGKLINIGICAVLALGTLCLYAPVRHYDFVKLDDDDYVTQNIHVLTGLTKENVQWAFTHFHSSNWHPVTWLSHMLDVQFSDLQAGKHHVTNIFIHTANGVLLFLILFKMTAARWPSFFVAAVFSCHPLHVESVAWISERKDLLSGFFFLLTIAAYISYVRRPRALIYLLVLLWFGLALMSKAMVVTLPLILLLLDYWPLRRTDNDWKNWFRLLREKIPLFAMSLAIIFVTLSTQGRSGAMKSMVEFPLWLRLSNAMTTYILYLGKFIFPTRLSVFYPFPPVIPVWHVVVAASILAAVTVAVFLLAKRHPYLVTGWGWYMITLLPVIGLIQVGEQAMADRYMYLPMIGAAIVAAWGCSYLIGARRERQTAALAASVVVLTTFMIGARRQLGFWQNSFTLFGHALRVTSNNWLAHNNLSNAFLELNNLSAAKDEAAKALAIRPDYPQANLNMGVILLRERQTSAAIRSFEQCLAIVPNWLDAHFNLGAALASAGRLSDALPHLYRALDGNPRLVPALKALAWIRATASQSELRNGDEAVELAKRGADLTRQREADMLDVLAAALAEVSRFDEAITTATQAKKVALNNHQYELAQSIEGRLQLYRLQLPYRSTVR